MEYLSVVTAGFSIIIASFALWRTEYRFKVGVKIDKLEEIYELVEYLAHYYADLLSISVKLDDAREGKRQPVSRRPGWKSNREIYNESVKQFCSVANVKDIESKIVKLEVLSRAYLAKSDQCQVMVFKFIFSNIINYSLNSQVLAKHLLDVERFPDAYHVNRLADDIANMLIDRISFSQGQENFKKEIQTRTKEKIAEWNTSSKTSG